MDIRKVKEQHNERINEKRLMNCGEWCTIIEYFAYNNITVKFDNGKILKNKSYQNFKIGSINGIDKKICRQPKRIIGERFDSLVVISLKEKIRTKGNRIEYYYNCKCDCGNEVIKSVQALKNKTYTKKCNMCSKSLDVIYNKYPEFVKYFKNIEDSKRLTMSSDEIVDFVCPNCGFERKARLDTYSSRGFKCNVCSDNISYPEKFMIKFLQQLKLQFEREKKFDWSLNKRYDFYIPSLNCIIETHGEQHYKDKFSFNGKNTRKEEKQNDIYKMKIAKENKIKEYIQLDCSESKMEYIINSIYKSRLIYLLDITMVDFKECEMYASSSILFDICNFWNNMEEKNMADIFNEFVFDRNTIARYLKIGNNIGLCEYNPKLTHKLYMKNNVLSNINRKPIKCIELNLNFDSITLCIKYFKENFGTYLDKNKITSCCKNIISNYKGYHFEYIEKT